MTRMTGPDCVVMCNLINTYIHTYTPDCVVMCNLINTYIHTYIHVVMCNLINTYIHTYIHIYIHTYITRMTRMTGPDCVVDRAGLRGYVQFNKYI